MRLEKQKRKKESKVRKGFRTFGIILTVCLFIIVASAFGFGVGMYIEQKNYIESIGKIEVPEATLIYAVDKDSKTGKNQIIAKLYKENRINVELKDIPQNLQNAVIAIEDKRFYEHNGVDLRGVARALVVNILKGNYSQGASTISMQLARNVKLNSKKTLSRKIQEIIIAAQIEQTMTKEEILESYLNSIYLGSGSFGVETASQMYFGKHVRDIDLSEAAMLAGLPKAPSLYSPHKNYDAAMSRRNVVLQAMFEEGFISKKEYEDAKDEKIVIKEKTKFAGSVNKYPQILNAVLEELRKKFDEEQIYNGGLRVYTTIDTRIQECAIKAVNDKMGSVHRRNHNMECAMVAMDPATGFITAMVGAINPDSEFNRCTQAKRQPGSVFKPIVYYTAMEKLNWGPETRISNERLTIGDWSPKNFDGHYGGNPTMKTAIAKSINLPAIRAGQRAGMQSVIEMAKRMGITSELEPYLATCIGAGNIRLTEMIQVFNVTANDGKIFTPTLIKKVYDTAETSVLADNTGRVPKRVISSRLVKTMDEMLRNVVTSGTGRPVSSVANARGKTGTNGKTDVSFAGYVPGGMSGIVWIGDDRFKNIPNYYSGGGTCGPIWVSFMKNATPYFIEDKNAEEGKPVKEKKEKEEEKEYRPEKTDTDLPEEANAESEGQVIKETETDKTTEGDYDYYSEFDEEAEPEREKHSSFSEDTKDTIYVDVCPASNKLPNANCPSTVLKRFKSDSAPKSTCDIH